MRAVQFDSLGGPDVLQLREVSPPMLADAQVLVDVHAVSVNPIDWKVRSGKVQMPLNFPAITGRDGAGIVRKAGSGADASLEGRRVAFFGPRGVGTWAEQLALPAENVALIPDGISFAEAAALPLAGSSAWIPLVEVANVSQGMRVLIHAGSGGVGSFAIQIADARGCEVIATCSRKNIDFVRSLGAHKVVAYDDSPFEQQVRDVDVVFDLMGGAVHERSYGVLKRGGMIVCLMAEPYTDRSAEFGVTVKNATIVPTRAILEQLLQMVKDGTLRVPISETLSFSQFREAQAMSQAGHVRGKIVLQLRHDDGTRAG